MIILKRREFKKEKPSAYSHTVGNRPVWWAGLLTGKEALVHRDRILDKEAFYMNLPLWRVASKRLPIKPSPSILK